MPRERPCYVETQLLRCEDMRSEQSYRLESRYSHNKTCHGQGILNGFRLIKDVEKDRIIIEPGMAIDGLGRDMALLEAFAIPERWFEECASELLDIWAHLAPISAVEEAEAVGNPSSSAVSDSPIFLPVPAEPNRPVDPRDATGFPRPPKTFLNLRLSSSEAWWRPVYLGRIQRVSKDPLDVRASSTKQSFCTTAGAGIVSQSRSAALEWHGDRHQAAVTINQGGKPRLMLRSSGAHQVGGGLETRTISLAAQPDLIDSDTSPVIGGGRGVQLSDTLPEPTNAIPWRIYRTSHTPTEQEVAVGNAPRIPTSQLRIEIAGSDGVEYAGDSEFVVGRRSLPTEGSRSTPEFLHILRASPNGDVRISARITLSGPITESVIEANPADPRYHFEIIKAWLASPNGGAISERLRARANLKLQISDFRVLEERSRISCKVKVRNRGAHVISDLSLSAAVVTNNAVTSQGQIWSQTPGESLQPRKDAEPIPLNISIRPAEDRRARLIRLKLAVVGCGQHGTPVFAVAEKSTACDPIGWLLRLAS